MAEETPVYAVVGNIPPDYHSSDLRNYFSQFIETKGFDCFHFKHRPETRRVNKEPDSEVKIDEPAQKSSGKRSTCCVVRLKEPKLRELIRMYHRKHWLDRKGEPIPRLCLITKVKAAANENEGGSTFKTRSEQKQIDPNRENFKESDLGTLQELRPPDIMPNGNVGTPTMVFLDYIRQCRLPPAVIKNLGLTFPKTRTNKKYGTVPFDYGGDIDASGSQEDVEVTSGCGHRIEPSGTSEGDFAFTDSVTHGKDTSKQSDGQAGSDGTGNENGQNRLRTERKEKWRRDKETKKLMAERIEEKMIGKEDESEEDNDSCEEWERHEALHDDPANQERNKDRLFEDEIELKWEKGGSGLVFYTDAQYWEEQEGDFDEQTADDWDVDMSGYYEEGAGDKDARDYITIREEQRRRAGIDGTDRFSLGLTKRKSKQPKYDSPKKIGKFEKYSKGVGRKILEQQGWSEGQGLGSSQTGIADALENEGQNPRNRKGFGYHGEKLNHNVKVSRPADRKVIISTIFDKPSETDPQEPLLRRSDHYTLKYRDEVKFTKSSGSTDG